MKADLRMESPLRLVATHPLGELSRTVEALLVIASAPLSFDELAAAADAHPEQVEQALRLVGERFAEGRSGIVLEYVAGGWAFRASRVEAAACARLFERPAQRVFSQAALETSPSSRPRAVLVPTSRASAALRPTPESRTSSSAASSRRQAGSPAAVRSAIARRRSSNASSGSRACPSCHASTTSEPTPNRSASGSTPWPTSAPLSSTTAS